MGNNQTADRKDNSSRLLILLLLLISIVAVCVSVWALFFRQRDISLTPDYAPQDKEEYAESIPNDSDDKLDAPQGGGAVSLTYANQVGIDLSTGMVSLFFANPGKSNQDMVLQIVIREQIIVQSGTLSPGHRITQMELMKGVADMLSVGGYDGRFVVLYYNQETGEKSIVNTEIPVKITVTE